MTKKKGGSIQTSAHHVTIFIMLIFNDEDHVKARQDGRHEVDVLITLGIIPTTEDAVGCRQHRAAWVEGGGDASLQQDKVHVVYAAGELKSPTPESCFLQRKYYCINYSKVNATA